MGLSRRFARLGKNEKRGAKVGQTGRFALTSTPGPTPADPHGYHAVVEGPRGIHQERTGEIGRTKQLRFGRGRGAQGATGCQRVQIKGSRYGTARVSKRMTYEIAAGSRARYRTDVPITRLPHHPPQSEEATNPGDKINGATPGLRD